MGRLSKDEEYQRYLCSRAWAEKRAAVHRRCGGMCERCHVKGMEVVHHLTYIRIYNERLEDLAGICHECHDEIHAIRELERQGIEPERAAGEAFGPIRQEDLTPCSECDGKADEGAARNNKGEWICRDCAERLDWKRTA